MLGVAAPRRLRAHAWWRSRESLVEYRLEVDHDRETWSATDLTHGVTAWYHDGFVEHGDERTPSRSYRARVSMVPLTLVFPERLPVWGRPGDSDIPVSVESIDDDLDLITVRSAADVALRKTLVFDHRLGLLTRFDDDLTVTILDELEVG